MTDGEKLLLDMIEGGRLGSCYACSTVTTTRCRNPGHARGGAGAWICESHESDIAGVCLYCRNLGYQPPADEAGG